MQYYFCKLTETNQFIMKKLLLIVTVILFASCQNTVDSKLTDDVIKSVLKDKAVKLQDAILNQNLEEFNKYVDVNIPFSTGDSNLSEFYIMNSERFDVEQLVEWDSFDLYDINVSLMQDSKTAVLTFYARGEYRPFQLVDIGEEIEEIVKYFPLDEPVKYNTRASSVWVYTKDDWKIVHSNWAPIKGGVGIP